MSILPYENDAFKATRQSDGSIKFEHQRIIPMKGQGKK